MITTLTNGLLSVLLAPTCAACNAVLDEPLDGCVCRNCWEAVEAVSDLDFPSDAPLAGLISAGSYDKTLREIIHALKYQGRRSIASHLAHRMRRNAGGLLVAADFVVPVPLHWRRQYSRGFNQAREIARHLGVPVVDALRRSRFTAPQVTLSADERHANVQGAFVLSRRTLLHPAPALEGCSAVVIDDVATTGATLWACAAVLRGAGAREVWGLTAARKI
jgi:ComF family protein